MWPLSFILLLLWVSQLANSYKILVISPIPGKSHGILGDGIVRNLLADGHEVTYITAFADKNSPRNLHQVDVSSTFNAMDHNVLNITALLHKEIDLNDIGTLFGMMFKIANATISHENVQKLMRDTQQQFDVIIAEWMFTELYAGFQAVFKCPYIWYSTVEPHWMVLRLIDENPNPAYAPDIMSANMGTFSFMERVQSLLGQLILPVYKYLHMTKMEIDTYEKYFGPAAAIRGHKLPQYDDVVFNASLMLGNSHVSMGSALRLPQSYKAIGGYHIDSNIKPLSEDLKKTMEGNQNGVIYFSMGSNLKSKDLPESIKKSLLQMFSTLKQTVLWKFEEDFPDLPKNVHILKWAPQPSILAHPNCVLFITHGGLLSTTETIKFGKPVIGIPVFADQFTNVGRAVSKGFARKVDLSYDMADELKAAIEEILGNPKYSERAAELSFIFHDRPTAPGAELAHWVRHVAATRGAPHLRSPALALPCWQRLYLDLAAALLAVAALVYWALSRLCCKRKVAASAAKKNM